MITMRSFLRFDDGTFKRIEDCETSPPDADYIEGAIELIVDDVEIIGQPEWDYVDPLRE